MSSSKLVSYTKLSPHKRSRLGKKICKITSHHAATVNASLKGLGNAFSGKRIASANYGIDSDGNVGMYVEEKYRAIASSNTANDCAAVTIEVSNDGGAPDWHVSDKALATLIDLCVDICKRNGIEKLNFTGTKKGNLTLHNMFTATTCPGPYLESKMPYIEKEVNKRLSAKPKKTVDELAKEVLAGKHGTGTARKKSLGDLYDEVQARVNEILKGKKKTPQKSLEDVAKAVIRGEYGTGSTRKKKLKAEGYDPAEVQAVVNKLLS